MFIKTNSNRREDTLYLADNNVQSTVNTPIPEPTIFTTRLDKNGSGIITFAMTDDPQATLFHAGSVHAYCVDAVKAVGVRCGINTPTPRNRHMYSPYGGSGHTFYNLMWGADQTLSVEWLNGTSGATAVAVIFASVVERELSKARYAPVGNATVF